MAKKLHVLFLCGWYPSRVLPTNGDFIQRHAETVQLLHEVSVIHIVSDKNWTKNIEITSEKINGVTTHIAYIKTTKNPLKKIALFYSAFNKLIQIKNFDIIHLNELFPFGLFTFLVNKPFLISEHWTGYHNPQVKKLSFLRKFLSKNISKRAKFVCPVSDELQESMLNFGLKGTYKIVPNVVNTDIFIPAKKEKNTIFTLVHISNMNDNHKNVSGILRAVSKLKFDYKLFLIGENSSQYKSVASDLKITQNIEFIEQISHKEIPKHLQNANAYISFSNYETWGIVMMEAIACGTPVISTKTGIVNELQLDKFSVIINKQDELALTKAIEQVKNTEFNPQEMHTFVKSNFSAQKIASEFDNLYQKSI